MHWRILLTMLLGLQLPWDVQARDAPVSSMETRFDALHRLAQDVAERPQLEQAPIVRARFERDFATSYSGHALQRTHDRDLTFLLRAAGVLGFFSDTRSDLEWIERPLRELERRGSASEDDRLVYFRALVGLRLFDTARAYRDAHGLREAEPIPDITSAMTGVSEGPIVYEAAPDTATLVRRRARIDAGVHLVVVSLPLCGFSRSAMETLSDDPVLGSFIRERTTWLAPVARRLDFDALQAWNRAHPATPVVLAERREDWSFIKAWSTPTFHVLKDGQLIGSFEGWPREQGRRLQLAALLRHAGVDVGLDMDGSPGPAR